MPSRKNATFITDKQFKAQKPDSNESHEDDINENSVVFYSRNYFDINHPLHQSVTCNSEGIGFVGECRCFLYCQ